MVNFLGLPSSAEAMSKFIICERIAPGTKDSSWHVRRGATLDLPEECVGEDLRGDRETLIVIVSTFGMAESR